MKPKIITIPRFLILLFVFVPILLQAQINIMPYSYGFYQKIDRLNYSINSRNHTAVKPFLIDSSTRVYLDSLIDVKTTKKDNWISNSFFKQHLIELDKNNTKLTIDVLPDFILGKGISQEVNNPYLGSLGLGVNATVGDKISLHFSGFVNHAVFPNYMQSSIDNTGVIPSFGLGKVNTKRQSWEDFDANATYVANKYFNVSISYGKNFIGDGYRSMLLSDVSSNYSSLKLSGNLGNVQYTSMWTHMLDPFSPSLVGNKMRGKWGAFQYLDWNVSNRISLGFFQSIIWANRLEEGFRGFEFAYLNPLVFLRPIESADPSSLDKMHLGVNAKYKIGKNVSLYGQFLLGEFTAKEFFSRNGYIHNKWGIQTGIKGFDILKVENLNFLAEFNAARPYTYSHFDPASNYSNFSQPLAHPLGANFKEGVGIIKYSYNQFNFSLKGVHAVYGLDAEDQESFGQDIFKSYNDYESRYGNFIGQGLKTTLTHLDAKVSYILNPKTNLRIEMGSNYYIRSNELNTNKSFHVFIGLRSAFRNTYTDY